jgi:hypothetical protein
MDEQKPDSVQQAPQAPRKPDTPIRPTRPPEPENRDIAGIVIPPRPGQLPRPFVG